MATQWGAFLSVWGPRGLKRLFFPSNWEGREAADKNERMLKELLERYIGGEDVDFSRVPLDLEGATFFQRRVWKETIRIPYGTTVTYKELATRLGIPGGAKAVGQALKRNPVPIIIPCHRVVGKKGLTGFSGGLDWKKRLISLESGG